MRQHRMTAAILSAICMGLGQLYNRQWIKGVLLLIVGVFSLYYFINNLGDAIWGMISLGEQGSHLEKVNGLTQMVAGDHSINLLIEGLITLILFAIFLLGYYANIRNAYNAGKQREKGVKPNNFRQTLYYIFEWKFAQSFLTLPAIGILFFTVMPIIFMVLLAFTNYSAPNNLPPANLVDWVGFQTFTNLIALKSWSHTFFGVLTWTIIWAVLATVTTYFGGVLVALLIQQKGIRFKGVWRVILIIPYAIPQLISLLVMRNMFNGQFGPINQYLRYFGLEGLPWLTDPIWAKFTVIIVNMWVGIPVSMLLVMSVLTTIPKDLYEAADVDGATGFQKFKIITLPMIMFSTAPVLITQFAGNINNFNLIFLLTNGNPVVGDYQYAGATDLLVTWLYKLTLDQQRYSMASAIGIIIFMIIASFSIYNYRRTRSFKEEDMIQ
ncbi:binding-protein-dependent transport systems inner membrane component [Paenibacillus vortex V453]|jgi:arabinogalactan oligomer/maltooligosaccharide transport system permease protein|uniref:Maltose/maltodextrin transport system permease protein n=2 Tax=Paenibacillus TaxID=44249 RepID=A0A163K5K6_9BACL|nr:MULTISPECIES: sugar ABC transporter permease [Paenibacillus]ANA80989.1 sugar ABC transporter permease [Paenibacillus glucanolyticus]AVV54939.1 sugar ABC transporter permease [Paenibacillus glucanolyticus]AWP29525.1 sugar ABC transporter permease [Paenibacillus sp. Cedars]EFU42594.1 binding-protein-dependent transport systems inner membrane component [Paenibacillus vortex V453]ETT36452.1 binding-protein-dependent transport systems inner membrane component [Paenibacillus sp. FSL R5-808]